MDLSPQMRTEGRRWLADAMRGREPGPTPFATPAQAVAAAEAEGVMILLADRLRTRDPADPVRIAFTQAARAATAVAMLREAQCRRVLALLEEQALQVLLLKGSALAWWLYPSPHLRECSDIDLLLANRDAVGEAARRLATAGHDAGYIQGDHAYEQVCRRVVSSSLHMDIDLHWRLNNAPVFAQTFDFEELFAASIELPALGPQARGLAPAHALLHACMHRAINLYTGIGDNLKWLYDLHLLARVLTTAQWHDVQRLCDERGLGGVCIAGLEAASQWFGEGAPEEALAALRSTRGRGVDGTRLHDWRYMHGRNLAALPSFGARADWIWRKVFPPVSHLRQMYGEDKRPARLWCDRALDLLQKSRAAL